MSRQIKQLKKHALKKRFKRVHYHACNKTLIPSKKKTKHTCHLKATQTKNTRQHVQKLTPKLNKSLLVINCLNSFFIIQKRKHQSYRLKGPHCPSLPRMPFRLLDAGPGV